MAVTKVACANWVIVTQLSCFHTKRGSTKEVPGSEFDADKKRLNTTERVRKEVLRVLACVGIVHLFSWRYFLFSSGNDGNNTTVG